MSVFGGFTPMPTIEDTCKNCGAEVTPLAIYCDYCRLVGYEP